MARVLLISSSYAEPVERAPFLECLIVWLIGILGSWGLVWTVIAAMVRCL